MLVEVVSARNFSSSLPIGGGGVRSFFIKSNFFQLVVEEGGRYFLLQIFQRGEFFLRLVFMGKNAAQWLMNNIEHLVVGKSSKQFFYFQRR